MQNWKLFAIVLPIFLLIDLVWLGVVMKGFYSQELGELARRQGAALAPRWGAAILVYLLIPGGLVLFVRPLAGGRCDNTAKYLAGERHSGSFFTASMI